MNCAMKAVTPATPAQARRPRRSTIYEVAVRAGVSIATVSRVQRGTAPVAELTRQRVLDAIAELGHRPSSVARSLAERRHYATGIVFPDLSGPYFSAVILGYEEAAAELGHGVLILSTHGREDPEQQCMDLTDRVDGVVVMGRTVPDDLVARLRDGGVPIVLLARPALDGIDSVRAENQRAAAQLVTHLIGHGYRRMAFLGAPDASPDAAERWMGYAAAHRRAGLPQPAPAVICGFRESDGYDAALGVLRGPDRPDAIVCANDEIGLGVYAAAATLELTIPDDLAVTGWDDITTARYVSPSLTTVRQPMRQLGVRAAQVLFERLADPSSPPRRLVLPTEPVLRQSCGCPMPEGGAYL
jgi:LacI family transcriptional regulator